MRILIGEDDILIAEHLKDILQSFKYEVIAIEHNKEDILEKIDSTKPDIALLDIRMKEKYDGVEIGEYILQNYNFPIIYITAHSDKDIIEKALKTKPSGYIIKPFKPMDVYTAMQIAVENFRNRTKENCLIIKTKYKNVKVPYYNILFLKSDNNYIDIQTSSKKYVERTTLEKLQAKLNSNNFIRIHRSYIVNVNNVNEFMLDKVVLNKYILPVSRKYRDKIKKHFDNLK